MIAGIDGYGVDWVAAIDVGSAPTRIQKIAREELPSFLSRTDFEAAVIDVPIGLPTVERACDVAARSLLGRPRNSRVFPAPLRPMLAATSWEKACEASFRLRGKKLSLQAFEILRKICG